MSKTIRVKATVEVPRVPNFLRLSDEQGTLSIADVEDSALRGLGKRWTEALIQQARNLRRRKERP